MRKLRHGSLWGFYVSFGEVSRMQDYFKSILVVEWLHFRKGERGGLVVNVSDSGSRGRGFEPHSCQTVSCP